MPTNKIASDGGNVVTKNASGNVSITGTLNTTGATVFNSTVTAAGKITATSGLTISNKVDTNQSFIWHIGAYDFVDGASYNPTSGCCSTLEVSGVTYAPFKVPYQLFGGTVILDQITIYYFKPSDASVENAYFNFYLMRTDRDDTITTDESETNIGFGAGSGAASKTCLASDLTLSDYNYFIRLDTVDEKAGFQFRFYDIKVEGHLG